MNQRELTQAEEAELNQAISDYVTATMKKKEIVDRLMVATSIIAPGDLIYTPWGDGVSVTIRGVVVAYWRAASDRQHFLLDNTPRCHYVYTTNDNRTLNTKDLPEPFVSRQKLVEVLGEEKVQELDDSYFKLYPGLHDISKRVKADHDANQYAIYLSKKRDTYESKPHAAGAS
jgi:hypothetical protein